MSYFSVFLVELCKTLESEWQEIKISTYMKKFHFIGNIWRFIKNENDFLGKIQIFATHSLINDHIQ